MPPIDPIPALKSQAAETLASLLDGWNADDIAGQLRTDQPRISEIRRGKLDRFSLETLIRYLTRMRCRVELHVFELRGRPGRELARRISGTNLPK